MAGLKVHFSASLMNMKKGGVSDSEDDDEDEPVGATPLEPEEWEHGTGHDYDGRDEDEEGY